MNADTYSFKLADFNCVIINDGTDKSPLSDLTTDVSEAELSAALAAQGFPSDELIVNFNCIYFQYDDVRVLVDTGWGTGTRHRDGNLVQHLATLDIPPDSINAIIITHTDGDHIGGIHDAEYQLQFPNARYFLWTETLSAWQQTREMDLPQDEADYRIKCLELISDRIEAVDAHSEFMRGFRMLPADGHRPGHAAVLVTSQGEQLIHLADAIIHPLLIEHHEWRWPRHSFPEQAQSKKLELLEMAANTNALIFGSHFPFPGLGRVTSDQAKYMWEPIRNGGS